MTSEDTPNINLGTGDLFWPTDERAGNRYGCVALVGNEEGGYITFDHVSVGEWGWLVAEVLDARESEHVGDVARGLSPETPEVGERIVLGEGTLWAGDSDGIPVIGLAPDDERLTDWLDPAALYRVVGQTVRLEFRPIFVEVED